LSKLSLSAFTRIKNNMQTELIIAGSGGQGVLFAGTLLAQAAVEENKETTWFPSYGAEIRGGTANSTVVVSDEEIGSPVVNSFSALIALNEQSLDKFLPKAKPGAVIIVNSSLVNKKVDRSDVKAYYVPASEIADKQINDIRAANLVALGAYLKASGILKLSSAKQACDILFAERAKLIPLNQQALELGYNSCRQG